MFFQFTLINEQPSAFISSIPLNHVRVNFVRVKGCTAQYLCIMVNVVISKRQRMALKF